jgi:hypothetical protein
LASYRAPVSAGQSTSAKKVDQREEKMLFLLQEIEDASRPITFETLDLILTNSDADKIVGQLSGITVDMRLRNEKALQLDRYLNLLERLAHFWGLI